MSNKSRFKVGLAIFLIAITSFTMGKVVAQGSLEKQLET